MADYKEPSALEYLEIIRNFIKMKLTILDLPRDDDIVYKLGEIQEHLNKLAGRKALKELQESVMQEVESGVESLREEYESALVAKKSISH